MDLRVPYNAGKFLSAAQLAASQGGLSSMELDRQDYPGRRAILYLYQKREQCNDRNTGKKTEMQEIKGEPQQNEETRSAGRIKLLRIPY
jgi:hypothetical protein